MNALNSAGPRRRSEDAVLLLAHGTIADLAELPEFLRSVRRGREAPPELIADMRHRYEVIGGSPLLAATERQARLLEQRSGYRAFVAMRLWNPTVQTVLPRMAAAGVQRACLLPLAPFSVEVYADAARRAQQALAGAGSALELISVPPWGAQPAFIRAQAEHIRRHLPAPPFDLVLTAHSLPLPVILAGDRYAAEVEQCAQAVSTALGMDVELAYQSQGAQGRWLGPDPRAVLERLAAAGSQHVVVAPFGFLAEHVETLYDLDIEAASWCRHLGLRWTRVPTLGEDAAFIAALHELVVDALEPARTA